MTNMVVISTEVLPIQYHWDPNCPIRGTEKFYVKTAEAVVVLGQQCVVIYDGPNKVVNEVAYLNRERRDFALKAAPAQLIVCNPRGDDQGLSEFEDDLSDTAITVWTNFFMPGQYAQWLGAIPIEFNDLVVISSYASRLITDEIPKVRPRIVPHGIDRSIYYPPEVEAREKIVVFSSSPDRGLSELRHIWANSDVNDFVLWTGSYGNPDISDFEVAEVLRKAAFWVHPGAEAELFCMAAVEAQACGCTPIVVPLGAVAETVRHGVCTTQSQFATTLSQVLNGVEPFQNVNADHIADWLTATAWLLGRASHPI